MVSYLFLFGPVLVFTISLSGWAIIPQSNGFMLSSNLLDSFVTFVFGGLSVYGLIFSGWASNSRYSFLGSVRAVAQVLSYELSYGMVNVIIGFFSGTFNYSEIVASQQDVWYIFPLFPVALGFLILMLAETNRTPFDLAEAEAELVAGYNVEYSGIMFALFFLGEYANMLQLAVNFVIYFLGGWLTIPGFCWLGEFVTFMLKIMVVCMFFIWVRATLPRYRYDQLLQIGWKDLLPLLFGLFFFYVGINIAFDLKYVSMKSIVDYYEFSNCIL